MPIYEYKCLICRNEFEIEQSIKDKPGVDCPKCLTWGNNRLISKGTNFVLSGDGWSADNYSSQKKSSE